MKCRLCFCSFCWVMRPVSRLQFREKFCHCEMIQKLLSDKAFEQLGQNWQVGYRTIAAHISRIQVRLLQQRRNISCFERCRHRACLQGLVVQFNKERRDDVGTAFQQTSRNRIARALFVWQQSDGSSHVDKRVSCHKRVDTRISAVSVNLVIDLAGNEFRLIKSAKRAACCTFPNR